MKVKPVEEQKSALVTTRLDADSHAAMVRLAEEADRTIAAEVRRAVRFYLADRNTEAAA